MLIHLLVISLAKLDVFQFALWMQAIVPFKGYLLVGFAGGWICAYSPDGTKDFSYEGDYLSTMSGEISDYKIVLVSTCSILIECK